MKCYRVVAEDLTHLGGPMGTEYTTESHIGTFVALSGAKLAAEKHYKKGRLEWIKDKKEIRTGDLGWVMYHIYPEEVK